MKKKEVLRIYKFPDANLVIMGGTKIAFMRRDAIQFADYGITPTMVNTLETKIAAFADFNTDTESLIEQVDATAAKNTKAAELRQAISNVMGRVALKYAPKSPKYRKFGTATLSKKTDSNLLITGKRVVRVGFELLTELSANGLTAAILSNINTLCNDFETLIIEKEIKVGDRDIQQEARVEAGNAIYVDLAKYASAGQSIWCSTDVAKYNDYIIYNTENGLSPVAVVS